MKYITVPIFLFLFACSSPAKVEEVTQKLPHELRFTTFDLDDYSHIKVKCDIGRLKIAMRQYDYHKLEIHKSYQKYVRFNIQNDTLFVETINTPRNAKDEGIAKNISFYAPNFQSISANASRISAEHLSLEDMEVTNISSSFRLYDSVIKNLKIINEGKSNVLLDANNAANQLYIKNNDKSIVKTMAEVKSNLTIEAKSLSAINWKSVPDNILHWIK